jgi:hypothetical protein
LTTLAALFPRIFNFSVGYETVRDEGFNHTLLTTDLAPELVYIIPLLLRNPLLLAHPVYVPTDPFTPPNPDGFASASGSADVALGDAEWPLGSSTDELLMLLFDPGVPPFLRVAVLCFDVCPFLFWLRFATLSGVIAHGGSAIDSTIRCCCHGNEPRSADSAGVYSPFGANCNRVVCRQG